MGLPAAVAAFQAAAAEPLLLRHSDRKLAEVRLSNPTLRIELQKIPNRIKSQSLMPNQSQNWSIIPKKRSNRDLNPNRDSDSPITGCFTLSYINTYIDPVVEASTFPQILDDIAARVFFVCLMELWILKFEIHFKIHFKIVSQMSPRGRAA